MGQLVDVHEAAAMFDVPYTWFYKRTTSGELPTQKLGKYVRFDVDDLSEWIRARKEEPKRVWGERTTVTL